MLNLGNFFTYFSEKRAAIEIIFYIDSVFLEGADITFLSNQIIF